MSKVNLNDILSGYKVSKINDNFSALEDLLNNKVLFRGDFPGEPNYMQTVLDMNGFRIINSPDLATASGAGSGNATDLAMRLLSISNVAEGDALIGVKYNATGSLNRTQHDKNSDSVHIKDFVPASLLNGSGDCSAYVQAALNASYSINLGGPEIVLRIDNVCTLRSGTTLYGNYPEIRQGTGNREIFNIEGKSNIRFSGLTGIGIGTDHNDSDSSRAVFAYGGTSGSNIQTLFCRFYGFAYTPIRHAANVGVVFGHNTVEGPGSPTLTNVTSGRCYGFLADSGCVGVKMFNNTISKTAQGARFEQVTKFSIEFNDISGIVGQHGFYLGSGLSNGVVIGNIIDGVPLEGVKLQAANGAADCQNITISFNVINLPLSHGILTCNSAGATPQVQKCRNISIVGNIINTPGGSAINIQNTIGCTLDSNVGYFAGESGIFLSASSNVTIDSGNIIDNSGLSGIRDASPCTDIVIKGLQIRNPARLAAPGDKFGILVQDMTLWSFDGPVITDTAAKMQYGLYCVAGDQTTLALENMRVYNSTDYGLRVKNATDTARIYQGNYFTGTLGATFNEPPPATVASAATLVLPQMSPVVKVSGAVTITSIDPKGHSGKTVSLLLTSTAQITDGGNIKLVSTHTGAANRTMALFCDGTDWWETGRAAT